MGVPHFGCLRFFILGFSAIRLFEFYINLDSLREGVTGPTSWAYWIKLKANKARLENLVIHVLLPNE